MSPDCPPASGPRPRRPRVSMPEFTSLVRPAGPEIFRRTELSARIDFSFRTGFLVVAFFFRIFFLEAFFLGVAFLRDFFFVGMRKVYHYQIARTMRPRQSRRRRNRHENRHPLLIWLLTWRLTKVESSSETQHLTNSSAF